MRTEAPTLLPSHRFGPWVGLRCLGSWMRRRLLTIWRSWPECVVNIPSPEMWQQVEKLAPLTGKNPVPEIKARQFRFEPNKFDASGLSPMASDVVKSERAKECPV